MEKPCASFETKIASLPYTGPFVKPPQWSVPWSFIAIFKQELRGQS